MYQENTKTEELYESSANFDPLLNQEMCQLIFFHELSAKYKSRYHQAQFPSVKKGLDEFEQALI